MVAVMKREIQSYLLSPIGYVFLGVYLLLSGIFFAFNNIGSMNPEFSAMFSGFSWVFILITPILTMRLLSEEKRNKTDQMLLTAPVSVKDVVLGKYFAALFMMALALVLTIPYPIILAIYGEPMLLNILSSYLGLLLISAAFISIGLFISAMSESQVIAAIVTIFVLFIMLLLDSIVSIINSPFIASIMDAVSLFSRFSSFELGVFSISSVVYYVSFSAVLLVMTVLRVEKRRWSEG